MGLKELERESSACEQPPQDLFGRVALVERERFLIWTENGEVEATVSGQFRRQSREWPCAGDWVTLRRPNVITRVLSRRTKLSRKEPGKALAEQTLAANIDVLFVVSGLDRDYNPRRLERYLVLAHESGARPVILLNKADLRSDSSDVVRQTEEQARGVSVFTLSARERWGLEAIPAQLKPGETAALIGSSGAGKSTILNALLGADRQATASVREADSKGRHTTTRRELFLMPGNWFLIDLPGLRELQLWAEPGKLDDVFSEIAELASSCRFRDCTHQTEPGCAVRTAELDPERLAGYHKLQRELAFLERQNDPQLARDLRKKWNALEKQARCHPRRFR